jgi:hypothetical protein
MTSQSEITPEQVGRWMVDELERVKWLYQQEVVWTIQQKFGKQFVYENQAGNLAIDWRVLQAFERLTGDSVVWQKGERMWRKREAYDAPGRKQS